jgi:hypothetical protein
MDFNAALRSDLKAPEIPPDTLDIETAKANFAPYRATIEGMLEIAQNYRVSDQKSNADAVAKISDAKKLTKTLESERKRVIKEPYNFVSKVNSFVKQFTEPLKEIERILKSKVGQYQHRIELERRESEKKAREEAAKLQADLDKEAKAKGVEPVKVAPVAVAPLDTVTRTDDGASGHIRKEWVGEIENPSQVPREFCSPDQKLIREAVKAGKREIPGVKIYEKIITVVRG